LSKRTEFVISDDNDVFFLKLTKKSAPGGGILESIKMTGRLGFGGRREYDSRPRTESGFCALG
jgi:hypothetical protein